MKFSLILMIILLGNAVSKRAEIDDEVDLEESDYSNNVNL